MMTKESTQNETYHGLLQSYKMPTVKENIQIKPTPMGIKHAWNVISAELLRSCIKGRVKITQTRKIVVKTTIE